MNPALCPMSWRHGITFPGATPSAAASPRFAWFRCVWCPAQLSLINFSQESWVEPYHQPNQNNVFFSSPVQWLSKSVLCRLSDVLESTPKSHKMRKNRGRVSWLSWMAVLVFIPKFGNEVSPKRMVIDARGFLTLWAAATYRLTVRQPFHRSELGLLPPPFHPPVISSYKNSAFSWHPLLSLLGTIGTFSPSLEKMPLFSL